MVFKKKLIIESLLFIGAGVGAGEKKYSEPVKKIFGAGQKWTGSATLLSANRKTFFEKDTYLVYNLGPICVVAGGEVVLTCSYLQKVAAEAADPRHLAHIR